jgi:hypothetical protein
MPPAGRATCSIDTTVAFGLELAAVALPLVEAPCAPLPAASDVAPLVLPVLPVLPVLAAPVAEVPDWS